MKRSEDEKKEILSLVAEARKNGARIFKACDLLAISTRTCKRWKTNAAKDSLKDGRKGPGNIRNKLSDQEKKQILTVCNSPEFMDKPPCQIVPALADRGQYIASESSMYGVLKASDQLQHRGKSKSPAKKAKPVLVANKPNEVWSWDITWLKGPIKGSFFYLYLMIDIFSRKIVAWRIEERESQDFASSLIKEAAFLENIDPHTLTLHADNGPPMKGSTMLCTLEWLGVKPSFIRPSVSNDNPFSESVNKTVKYMPDYPQHGFANIAVAREWVEAFVSWYNFEHKHSGIKFVTPNEKHEGLDVEILKKRENVYALARQAHPERWINNNTRNWDAVCEVSINKENHAKAKKKTQHKKQAA